MAKRRRGRTAKAKGISKRWSSDNVQIRGRTKHKSWATSALGGKEPGKDGGISYRAHVQSTEETPLTKFSLKDWLGENTPRAEVLKKLARLEVLKTNPIGGIVTEKFRMNHPKPDPRVGEPFNVKQVDKYSKLPYEIPTVAVRPLDEEGTGRGVLLDTYYYYVIYRFPHEELRMYFSGASHYYVKIGKGVIKRSIRYKSSMAAEVAIQTNTICWFEEISFKE